LDSDSDADGCFDAIEGGGSFTAANLTSGRLPGPYTNGVPNSAGAGQTVSQSVIATQLLLIRPCEVLSRITNVSVLEVAHDALGVLLQHRHMVVGRFA
jgi:hypothetical protein